MECHDIRENLSAYIDGYLSPEDRAAIEKHLQSCGKCSAALAELKKTVELLRDVEEVEPPHWLTQKTMAKIKAEAAARKGILRILFYPLHIKLPIEAVAVATIAVTSIYIFRTVQPEIKTAQERDIAVATRPSSPSESPSPSVSKPQKAQPAEPGSQYPSRPAENTVSLQEVNEAGATAEKSEEYATMKKDKKVLPPSPAGIQAFDQGMRSAASAPKQKGLPGKERAEEREGRLILTVTVSDLNKATRETVEVIVLFGGKIVKEESLEKRKVLHTELNSLKLGDLHKKLRLIGEVGEKEPDLKPREGLVPIQIDIIEK